MEEFATVILVIGGSAIAAILALICFCRRGRGKKDIKHPTDVLNKVSGLDDDNAYHEVEEGGQNVDSGGNAFMAGAALAAVTTAATLSSLSTQGGGGGGDGENDATFGIQGGDVGREGVGGDSGGGEVGGGADCGSG